MGLYRGGNMALLEHRTMGLYSCRNIVLWEQRAVCVCVCVCVCVGGRARARLE